MCGAARHARHAQHTMEQSRERLHLEKFEVGEVSRDETVGGVDREHNGTTRVLVRNGLIKVKDHKLDFGHPVTVDELTARSIQAARGAGASEVCVATEAAAEHFECAM
jgi:hypothetical protein